MVNVPTKANATEAPTTARKNEAANTDSLIANPKEPRAHTATAMLMSFRGPKWSFNIPTGICMLA